MLYVYLVHLDSSLWPCRSIVCLCDCCCSKCLGRCAAWMPLSSPPSSTPSSPWSWPETYRLTHKVEIFIFLCLSSICNTHQDECDCLISCVLPVFLSSEHQKMCYTALVLTMIFSMGEQVPYHHYGMIWSSCVILTFHTSPMICVILLNKWTATWSFLMMHFSVSLSDRL